MKFTPWALIVATASLVSSQGSRQINCGGAGPCNPLAECVNDVCVCGPGTKADPSVDPKLAGWLSCLDIDECKNENGSTNICAPASKGGACVDHDPPVFYQCVCAPGYEATEIDAVFGATTCVKKVDYFKLVAQFPVCSQIDAACDTDVETVAEIVTASTDGKTLIYTDSPAKVAGFVDISNPSKPKPLGTVAVGGEPTSVATKDGYALVAVNESADFINVAGSLVVIDISNRKIITKINLGGQPDSVAVSPDGKYAVVAIENERDEGLGSGDPPQMPAGYVSVVDLSDKNPTKWTATKVDVVGLPGLLYPTDPEPEFVSINKNNIAAVTLQENNAVVLIDLATKKVVGSFTAGAASLTKIDKTEEGIINQTDSKSNILREPDGIVWVSDTYYATADEGDLDGGSRGFTIFDSTTGTVVYSSGNLLEHVTARIGHYQEDRSGNKGNEPENVAFADYGGDKILFVNSERSSVIFVYNMANVTSPQFVQVLPAGVGPEGGYAIPSRNLYVVASEVDDRSIGIRAVVNIYQRGYEFNNYPSIESVDRADGSPIAWGALSGLAAEIRGSEDTLHTLYAIEDSYYKKSRMFKIDAEFYPAVITNEYRLKDSLGLLKRVSNGASLVNSDSTVNLDLEGIAVSRLGGFWVVSEGAGTVGDAARPVTSLNLLLKIDDEGVIRNVFTLPKEVNNIQLRFGFEGVAEGSGKFRNKVVVAFQRAWGKEANPRLGVFDFTTSSWTFYFYPLDAVLSQNGGWVGLSDIAPVGNGVFLVLERDNMAGPDGVIKRVYEIDLSKETPGTTISKTFVLDIVPTFDGILMPEKFEGLAVTSDGEIWTVNDNDGVEDNSGFTQLDRYVDTGYENISLEGLPPGYNKVTFVHINDHHSHFDEQSVDLFGSNIPRGLDPTIRTLRVFYGGFDRATTLMKAMIAEAESEGNDVVKLHAGDALTGTLYYTFFGPNADAAAMNVVGFDAMTLGNHEFDGGDANLAKFVRLLNRTTVLSANLNPAQGSAIRSLTGQDAIQPYFIKTLRNGQKLGICGITVKVTTELSSFPDRGTTLDNEYTTAVSCVAELKSMGINKIGLLTHIGYSADVRVMTDIEGVDFIIGGHSHSLLGGAEYNRFNLPAIGEYATMVNGVCVVQAWEYVRVVGALTMEFDTNGDAVACTGAARIPFNPTTFEVRNTNPRYRLNAADAARATNFLQNRPPFVPAVEDPAIVAALQPFVDLLQERSGEVIAIATEPICHTYGEEDAVCPGKELRSRLGGGVCNLVSRGFLFNVPNADFAIQNRGGCRTDILEGEFTYGEAFEILPFANTLVTLIMTGDQIRRVIEDSINFFLDPAIGGGGGSYAFAAGLRYEIDYTKPFGSRISNIEANRRLEEEWTPLDLTNTYTVVTNNFIATPLDGYFTFGEIDKNDPNAYVDTFVLYAQSFIDFVLDKGVISDPPLSEYSTQKITFSDGTSYSAV